ncbi:hypothetical protein OVA24_17135 [Luteolibacter sp. SL250]|uniref:hypothetical protein n=1 Tax=Luteolibacter sp. SL250 TaxID=2995170 RepID=UPI00226DD14E|nr:hypothetical protein [Luteolibacter sp. SL250]WAC18958.1 hypothetical protein OVA24_17135 [Luteolibacter sp. SL250]
MIRTSRFTLHALLVVACGVAGYIAGSPADSAASAQRTLKWKAAPRGSDDPRPRRIEDPVQELSRILHGKAQKVDLLSIISRIPAARMPEAARLLRDHAEAEQLDQGKWMQLQEWSEITAALYFHWAEIDPHAALADAMTYTQRRDQKIPAISGVLTAWMRTDPDAAYRAVKDDEQSGYLARDMIVQLWTPENIFENADRYPDKRGDLLGWYAIGHIGDRARREIMLEELRKRTDLKERSWVYALLFRAWGYNDFEAAMNAASKEKIPWLEKQLVDDNLEGTHNSKVFRWATANGHVPNGPQWEKGYGFWLMNAPEEARAWFATESPKWIEAGRNDLVAGFLSAEINRPNSILDSPPEARAARDALTRHWQTWHAADPEAAARWLDTAPADISTMLRKGGTP